MTDNGNVDEDGFGDGELSDVVLGRRRWSDDGSDDERERDRRRTRTVALTGLGVATALVIVVIVLVGVFVDTSPGPPASPRTAASAWANALVSGDTSRQRNLECARGSQSADIVGLVVTGSSSADAGRARRRAPDRWDVPVAFNGPDGAAQTSLSVTVLRERNRYVVC